MERAKKTPLPDDTCCCGHRRDEHDWTMRRHPGFCKVEGQLVRCPCIGFVERPDVEGA
jgi:hypothetical protein